MPPEVARVVLAVAVIVVGYALALALRFAAIRLLRRGSAGLLSLSGRGAGEAAAHAPAEATLRAQASAVSFAGRIVFWLVFLVFLGAGTTILGFHVVSAWLASLSSYLPHALAAAAIVLLGVLSGLVARATVAAAATSARVPHAQALGRAAQIAIIALAGALAIDELGVEITFLIVIAAVVLGATLGGAALAFGLGARTSVSNMLACHYLAKFYRVGQVVRVGEHEGRILELQPSAVILHTDAGKVYIPAREFATRPSILLSEPSSE